MKKWFSLTLVLVLALSLLAACSSKEKAKQDGDSSASPSATAGNGQEGKTGDKYAFPLAEQATLDILAFKATGSKIRDYNEYELFKKLEKDSNVHVDWTLVDESTLMEKLNLVFASGTYPDAVYGSMLGGTNLSSLAQQGILIPLNDLIDQYAPNLKKIFEEHPEYKAAVTHFDGNIYSLPKVVDAPFYQAPDTMWINKKWLDQVGLPVPTTTEELYEALKAFKGKDLNGNGKQDEIPMSFMYASHWLGGNSLANAFGIMDQGAHVYIKDNKLMYAPQQEEYKDYVTYMNGLYSEGLLDKEMFTQTAQVYFSRLQNEVPVIGVASYPINSYLTNGDEYVPLLGLKGPKGESGWKKENAGIWVGAFMITSANKNPEITMKWVDSHYAFEMSLEIQEGPVGLGLKKLADGKYEDMPAPDGMDNVEFNLSLTPGFNSPSVIPSENYTNGIFITPRDQQEMDAFKLKEPLLKYEPLNSLLVYKEEDYKKLEDYEDLNTYVKTNFAEFVINGITDEKWQKHVDQLKKLGVDQFLEIHSNYQLKK
ncbi:extracellular solute-binding protein [Paenibacillus eucommiae]|uniref:Aldouronate transport system substrate-binding protein n=1 Tax=Paenibacillus eucommiae TaxID=1355755 RepID=A0ABS4J9S9_9BACL|nr:extracellular solute-binding protein [Paenibacillus eucommiae]MBP1996608.1 putative aldouronate transport system substrate-binding protein [Paenibacillus eucommiae]